MSLDHRSCTLFGITFILIAASWSLATASPTERYSITWDLQLNVSYPYPGGSVNMCKGLSGGKPVGFIAGSAIWRTLDGVNWKQVWSPDPRGGYWWAGTFCFPDAKRIVAVSSHLSDTAATFMWSFDGGDSWTERQEVPDASYTGFGAVHFDNDTHGFILPYWEGDSLVSYYTTTGGKNPSDWRAAHPSNEFLRWSQPHPVWAFGNVTKTIALGNFWGSPANLCTTDNTGSSWSCDVMNQQQPGGLGSFATPNDAIGVDIDFNVYATVDGGLRWKKTATVNSLLVNTIQRPNDLAWIPNTDIAILVGGRKIPFALGSIGTFAHSLDRGLTWTWSMPDLPTNLIFSSVDYLTVSPTRTEVWVVGANDDESLVLHATVSKE